MLAFTLSASIAGLGGVLLLFKNRLTSAEPISVAFSGELFAMVVIGGMRSFLGPALGALFFVIFRDYLSSIQSYPWISANWLLFFGLLFVGFIIFSPTGLVGVAERLLRPFRKIPLEDAAMSQRKAGAVEHSTFFKPAIHPDGPVLVVKHIAKAFGGIKAVRGVDLNVHDCSLHALIGPNGAGKTTAFNLISGLFAPDSGTVLAGKPVHGMSPDAITRAGIGRAFQITSLFPSLTVEENVRLAIQAWKPERFHVWRTAASLGDVNSQTAELIRTMGLAGIEKSEAGLLSYGGQRLLDMSLALATRPRLLMLDEPLAGLAAAERARVGDLIKSISRDLPVLLVEHDIDRVFQIDRVTVMNDGLVLVDGTVEDARSSPRVHHCRSPPRSRIGACRPSLRAGARAGGA